MTAAEVTMEWDPRYITALVAFIIFVLGIITIPWVEHLKSMQDSRKFVKFFKQEIEDELPILAKSIKTMAASLTQLQEFRSGGTEKLGPSKYVPRPTSCYFLEKIFEHAFHRFNRKQRQTLKVIPIQIEAINKNSQDIKESAELNSPELLDEQIKHCKRFIFTACCLHYNFTVVKASNKCCSPEITDAKIIDGLLQRLEIELTSEDLKIVSKVTIDGV